MPDYTTIFEISGAFARVRNQLRQFALDDLTLSSGGDTFRSLDNLISRFVTLLNDDAGERRHLSVVDRLRTLGAVVDASWESVKPVLDDFLTQNVAADLGVGGSSGEVLAALARAMFADAESVQQNAVGVSAVSADPNNSGTGKAYASLLVPNPDETTYDSQLARNESVNVVCEVDSPNDGITLGKERWRARSSEGLNATATTIPVTSGPDEDARNLIIDGSFSDFTAGAFDHFSATGAALFSQNTSDTLFDGDALQVSGSGAATLTQILSDRSIPPAGGALMAIGIHRKVNSVSAGTLTLRLVADGAPLVGDIVIDATTPTGAWDHEMAFVYVPRLAFPDELKVEIVASAGFSGDVLFDGLSVAAADKLGHGLSLAIFQGPEPFTRSPLPDRFSFDVTSDEAGVFTGFFRDVYGIELPASISPTISDSLAI